MRVSPPARRRNLVALAAVLTAVLIVAAWYAQGAQPPLAELELQYPGATVILREESSSGTRLMLTSDADPLEIVAWYRAELDRRGYLNALGMGIPTTSEIFACAWHDEKGYVRLAFMDLRKVDPAFLAAHMEGQTTMYRWTVGNQRVDVTSSRPCDMLLEGDPSPRPLGSQPS